MGNPSIRTSGQAAPAPPSGNGVLASIPGPIIGQASDTLPTAADGAPAGGAATVEVPGIGMVRITFRLNTYRRGKSRSWHWVAVRADPVAT